MSRSDGLTDTSKNQGPEYEQDQFHRKMFFKLSTSNSIIIISSELRSCLGRVIPCAQAEAFGFDDVWF